MAIIKYIDRKLNITRSKIKNILCREYEYFYRHDTKWLKGNLPKPIKVCEAMKNFSKRYWISKDTEISRKILKLKDEILFETRNQKLTKEYICKTIGYYGIRKAMNLKRMPITKKLIENMGVNIKS